MNYIEYIVLVTSPTSIRFDDAVSARLSSYVARHPGTTRSSVAARYVDEGLRMEEHPGIVFRSGPTGRRAVLLGGPDVWEVVRAVGATRLAEPKLKENHLLALVVENTGVSRAHIDAALAYWAAYPDEIDAMITHADEIERALSAADRRMDDLLNR
ncbi:MAG: hypothetical protein QOC82_443 [Frankiaceae bacterium]|nr:hypothetical protein [Frankiaceae bacterium]